MFDDDYLKAFQCLKYKLVPAPIIIAPDWSKSFKVMCDTSGVALGDIIGQKKEIFFTIFITQVRP